ncbi:alpha-ketoglutarate-dependent dioxygenase AlkB family protein [Parahaliea mediterranea]|uniref:Alpha-ketoglutarate-dependent dioxygenase AlkB n=1 Tax=Parahaliea mediterranea TaxID=651086 RepID=A0A939DEM4_9GAMM|nr:alpha-ketoglutarate-dependent dioxygenase AlkB [Parahaliea mediterranea]MBN7796865.1 alpha-ketoglutarate-dependent dioxygenase AlkB [Parahaliea mediterranea]
MDLFDHSPFERLPLPDADLLLLRRIALSASPDALAERLIADTPWRRESITLWGKTRLQPRLLAWYGDPGSRYRYSGRTLEPLPWTPLLRQLKDAVERASGARYNSVLLNYYRDGRDSMGMHADDEPELGARPTVASLSLGAERKLVFRHRWRKDLRPVRLPLPSGSLLVMSGDTQAHWKHGIDKLRRACGPRINLTFRRIVAPVR